MSSRWDSPWRHHAHSTPLLAAATVYSANAIADLLPHHGYSCLGATGISVSCLIAIAVRQPTPVVAMYLMGAVATGLGLSVYALMFTNPYTAQAGLAFAIAAGLFWPLYATVTALDRRDRRRSVADAERLAPRRPKQFKAGDFPAMFAHLGINGITEVEHVETRAGYTKVLRLPQAGRVATYRMAEGFRDHLETMLDLDHGSLKFERGSGAEFFVHVATWNVMGETVPYPFDPNAEPGTINEPITLGLREDGEDSTVLVREKSGMASGYKGSGKSNLLNVIIAELLKCADVVIWLIDPKHRVCRPWVEPWLNDAAGRLARPVIDWVATTPEEAAMMFKAQRAAISYRSATGKGEKVIPSPKQPTIIIIGDEMGSMFGVDVPGGLRLAALAKQCVDLGRSEACDQLFTFLRATVTMIGSGDMKSQFAWRMMLRAATAAEQRLVADNMGMVAAAAEILETGTMVLSDEESRPLLTKIHRIEHEEIAPIARARTWFRPGLEPGLEAALERVAPGVYANRWSDERSGHLRMGGYDLTVPLEQAEQEFAAGAPHPATAGEAQLPRVKPAPKGEQPSYRTGKGQPIPRSLDDTQVDKEFAGLLQGELGDALGAVHLGKERMYALVRAAGPAGISPRELTEALNREGTKVGRPAVHDWLSEEIVGGRIVRRARGEYVAAEHA